MENKIRELAKIMLDLTIKIEKMEKQLDSLSLTQKHLRESNPVIKQMDDGKLKQCPTCEGKGALMGCECWRCLGRGVL